MNMWVSIIPLVIVLAIIWFCVRTLRHAIAKPNKGTGAAKCGKCGYEIADLSFDRCPECGGKLLEVGIVTPSLTVRRGSSVAGLIGTWSVLIVFLAFISFGVVEALWSASNANLPRSQSTRVQSSYTYQPLRESQSQLYQLTINLDVIIDAAMNIQSGTIELVITHPTNTLGSLELDGVTLEVLSINGVDLLDSSQDLLIDDILSAYGFAGLKKTDGRIIFEADLVFKLIAQAADVPRSPLNPRMPLTTDYSRGLHKTGSTSSLSGVAPPPIAAGLNRDQLIFLIGSGFWLIVYTVGLRLMLLGRKRALAGSD